MSLVQSPVNTQNLGTVTFHTSPHFDVQPLNRFNAFCNLGENLKILPILQHSNLAAQFLPVELYNF